ncbi:MAG TPA: CDP-alcohol phosphatidyltransferase family protein [Egibacteraceae bacterium]|nr:CDP-alcohol phosphatidyltransferase family protein [Egibacteraceae bacterium]HVM14602.1 CDP-alcohol phosphatidyltransferase family protein [Egibacteraceae bacterium]HVM21407.1 CDP-alcohol phosphatidyltransferase family protein [Egibacteraceae bacterium]
MAQSVGGGVLVALVVSGLGLIVVGAARRRPGPVPPREEYLTGWQALHGGYDVASGSPWVRGWLGLTYAVARPLGVAGVSPHVITALSTWLTAAVVAAAAAEGRWPLLGAVLLVLAGLGDSLDGAVAVMQRRASGWGYVVDSVADRVNDLLLLAALALAGAPWWLAGLCAATVFLHEYARARAGNAGAIEIGTVTVGERPSRIILAALGLAGAGLAAGRAPVVTTAALAALLVLSAIGLVQLLVDVRARLRRADEVGNDAG